MWLNRVNSSSIYSATERGWGLGTKGIRDFSGRHMKVEVGMFSGPLRPWGSRLSIAGCSILGTSQCPHLRGPRVIMSRLWQCSSENPGWCNPAEAESCFLKRHKGLCPASQIPRSTDNTLGEGFPFLLCTSCQQVDWSDDQNSTGQSGRKV